MSGILARIKPAYSIALNTVYKYSYRMQVEIHPLRRNGFRIPNREHGRGEPLRGTLVIEACWLTETQKRRAAILYRHGTHSAAKEHIIAKLFEPEIKMLAGARFVLTGWELVEWKEQGRQIVMQEWPCLVLNV